MLRLGDLSLVLGQRLGEWVGHSPALEEDLGLANMALDLIGQARLLLGYAGEIEGRGRDEDQLAFLREHGEYLNPTLAEQPNGDFGRTIVRQVLIDAFQLELYEAADGVDGRAFGGDRGKGGEGNPLPSALQRRLAGAFGRRHRRRVALAHPPPSSVSGLIRRSYLPRTKWIARWPTGA